MLHGPTFHGRMLRGGDLSKMDGLRHILSIGYEIECGVLAKLTQTDVGGELDLYNSDSARKDIEDLKHLDMNAERYHNSMHPSGSGDYNSQYFSHYRNSIYKKKEELKKKQIPEILELENQV